MFMADDKFVECSSTEYKLTAAIAAALVVVIVIGMPVMQYVMLHRWREPFDCLFVPTEEGHLVPSERGNDVLGPLYVLYKPRFYLWALADAAVKLIFTGVLGVVFKDAQSAGLIVSAIMCIGLAIVTAVLMPFAHQQANYVVLATYAAIMANCAEAASAAFNKAPTGTRAHHLHSVLEMIVLVLYFLPFAMGFWDLFEVSSWSIYRYMKRGAGMAAAALCSLGRRRAARSGPGDTASSIELQTTAIVFQEKDISREAQLDQRRSRALTALLNDIRPLASRAASGAKRSTPKGLKAKTWMYNVSNAVEAYNVATQAAVEVLGEFPLALTWKHYIAIESKARNLSKLVFEGQPDVMKGDQGEQGVVVLAFDNVHMLWRDEIARIVCVNEADGDDTAVPSMKSAVICRNATIALLSPGARMGSFRVAVNATLSDRSQR